MTRHWGQVFHFGDLTNMGEKDVLGHGSGAFTEFVSKEVSSRWCFVDIEMVSKHSSGITDAVLLHPVSLLAFLLG